MERQLSGGVLVWRVRSPGFNSWYPLPKKTKQNLQRSLEKFGIKYPNMFYEHLKQLTLTANVDPLRASSSTQQIFIVCLLGSNHWRKNQEWDKNKTGQFLFLCQKSINKKSQNDRECRGRNPRAVCDLTISRISCEVGVRGAGSGHASVRMQYSPWALKDEQSWGGCVKSAADRP